MVTREPPHTWRFSYGCVRSGRVSDGTRLAALLQAARRRSFPLCLYHSVVGWHHPSYPNQGRSHELCGPEPGDRPDWATYRAFLVAQVRELCTQYGRIHCFWWDMNVTGIVDRSINDMIRSLQPGIVINNRGFDEGDFGTPERDYEGAGSEALPYERPTEACQSVGRESWGYRTDEDYYSNRHLLQSIDRAMARGANYLLNVGPMADGTFPERAVAILGAVGSWYSQVKEALLDVEPVSQLIEDRDVLLTRRGNTLYVHLFKYRTMERVLLKPIARAPRSAMLLNTGEQVAWSLSDLPTLRVDARGGHVGEPQHYLRLCRLPVNEHAGTVLVVKLEFDGPPTTMCGGSEGSG